MQATLAVTRYTQGVTPCPFGSHFFAFFPKDVVVLEPDFHELCESLIHPLPLSIPPAHDYGVHLQITPLMLD